MRGASAPGIAPSMAAGASSCTFSRPELHQIIEVVVSLHRKGAAKWLQRVTGRAPRTVKYWLAGDFAPRGKDTIAIIAVLRAEVEAQSRMLKQLELSFE